MMDYYPEAQLMRGQGGRVTLVCTVAKNGSIDCVVVDETPQGKGFGTAAIRASKRFRIAPATENGVPTEGGKIRVPIRFDPPKG
jgi:periplasmic protein TonB